ncbi:MAG: aminotransferase class I/II-fold pyridoxal phosphate-dependent enzyme [Candidatus Hydrogenedentota bacterium]|nr:MAG: aminotransferase class I/II-fold pyridoxal phosphate-dependent enzyme [Candidatus Hydrogenedentota bacterium]
MGEPIPLAQSRTAVPLATVVQNLQPSGIREFFDIVASRPNCISLGVGEPDFVSPDAVIQAGVEALRSGYTHYTGNQGFLKLRKAISTYLQNEYSLAYDPETEILITVGVSQGLDLGLRSLINPGDKVLFMSPSYVSYRPMTELCGGVPVEVPVTAESDFLIPLEDWSSFGRKGIKVILLNYPGNPTGTSPDKQYLEEFAKIAQKFNWYVISDEIYADLTYDRKHIPLATIQGMKERTLLLGGFSKAYAMTGWRIGYACGPAEWIRGLYKIHQYAMLCAPTLSQVAAIAALEEAGEDKDKMKEEYCKRRNFFVKALNDLGLECKLPAGAFYVFPKIEATGFSSMEFARSFLDKENVAVVPGSAFGKAGEGYIRCSYATSLSDLEKAITRLERFLQKGI